jgi:hypothetical protein
MSTMSTGEIPPITAYIESLIAERFDSEETRQQVREMLLEFRFGSRDTPRGRERVLRDIVILSGCDVARVRRFVDMANRDWRDILSGEHPSIRRRQDVWKLPMKED